MHRNLNTDGWFRFVARNAIFLALSLVLAVSTASTAHAKTLTVKSGQKTVIDAIALYAASHCGSLLPRTKSTGSAENGEISTTWQMHTISSGSCKGRRVNVLVVFYTPKRGFRGRDKATLNYRGMRRRYSQSETPTLINKSYKINVK